MIDSEGAVQLWLENHEPTEWKQLLADYEGRAALPDDVMRWLRASSPELRMQLDDLTVRLGPAAVEALARFEKAFIGGVSEAAEQRKRP